MIYIRKIAEPVELTQLRALNTTRSPRDAYNQLKNPLKTTVLNSLSEEQGHLCAYCMARIPNPDVVSEIPPCSIEHIYPCKPNPMNDIGQGLDYQNMVAVCPGNKAPRNVRDSEDLTCDTHKGNKVLKKVNPIHEETLNSIYYKSNGEIHASDDDVESDLHETLNLNSPNSSLITERKRVLVTIQREIATFSDLDDAERLLRYRSLLDSWLSEVNPKTPYCGVIIWYLKHVINSLENA